MGTHVDEPIEDIDAIEVPNIELTWQHIPRDQVVNARGQAIDYFSLISTFLEEFRVVLRHLKTGKPFPENFVWFIPDFWHVCFGGAKCFTPTDALDLWDAAVLAQRVAAQFMTWGDREIFDRVHRGPGKVFVPRKSFVDSLQDDNSQSSDDARFVRLFSDSTGHRNRSAIRPDDILKAEAEIGYRLPESYVRFLLSQPSGPSFSLPGASFPHLGKDPFHVADFYSIPPAEDGGRSHTGGRDGLAATYSDYRNEGMVPAWLLPIGDNACGDLLCLELDGERRGGVAVWYHELYDYERNESMADCIIPVAPSFDEFLDLLEPDRDN
jgi:SMI1 / KNR4 family (SUKH-1)